MIKQSKTTSQLLEEILDELTIHNPVIISALVVSDDGLNVASGIPHHDDDTIAVSASDLIDTANNFSNRFEQGKLTRIVLEGERRTTVIMKAGKHTVLVALVPVDIKLGLVMLSMRRAADQITSIFG